MIDAGRFLPGPPRRPCSRNPARTSRPLTTPPRPSGPRDLRELAARRLPERRRPAPPVPTPSATSARSRGTSAPIALPRRRPARPPPPPSAPGRLPSAPAVGDAGMNWLDESGFRAVVRDGRVEMEAQMCTYTSSPISFDFDNGLDSVTSQLQHPASDQ